MIKVTSYVPEKGVPTNLRMSEVSKGRLIASASGSGSLESGGDEMLPGSPEAISYLTTVSDVYTKIGWAAVVAGVVVILISPLVKWLMHLDTLEDADHAMAGEKELAEPQAAGMDTSGETRD